jgi:hypothetical protein
MSGVGRDEMDPDVSCKEGQLDRQVYGSEIELAKTRRRPKGAVDDFSGGWPVHTRKPTSTETVEHM